MEDRKEERPNKEEEKERGEKKGRIELCHSRRRKAKIDGSSEKGGEEGSRSK